MAFRVSQEEIVFTELAPRFLRIAGQTAVIVGAFAGVIGGVLLDGPFSYAAFGLAVLCWIIIGLWVFAMVKFRNPGADRVSLDHRGLVCRSTTKNIEFIIPGSAIEAVGVVRGPHSSEVRLWYDEQAFPGPPPMVRHLRINPGELRLLHVGDDPGFVPYENVGKIREFVQRHQIAEWRNRRGGG